MENMEIKDREERYVTPLEARLWNRGASYAWADVDIKDTPKEYVFCFDIPEQLKNNVKIWINGNRLLISAERGNNIIARGLRKNGVGNDVFRRNFLLPIPVDKQQTIAQYIDGVLMVVLPKALMAKTININMN